MDKFYDFVEVNVDETCVGQRQLVPLENEVELKIVDEQIIIHPAYAYTYAMMDEERRDEAEMFCDFTETCLTMMFFKFNVLKDDYLDCKLYRLSSCYDCKCAILGFFGHKHRDILLPVSWSCSHSSDYSNPDLMSCGGVMPRVTSQGKTTSIKRHYGRIKVRSDDTIWEYGYEFDLREEKDMAHYLELLSKWLKTSHFSRDAELFTTMVKKWVDDKPYRKMALHMLRQCGDTYAAMYLCALSGKLDQDRMDSWKHVEAQFVSDLISLAWLFVIMWGIWKVHQNREAILAIPNLAKSINRFTEPAGNFMTIVEKTVDNVVEAGKSVIGFFTDLMERVVKKFQDMDMITKELFTGLVKVTLVIVAFEFARTMFPDIYKQVKEYVAVTLGYETTHMTYENVTSQGDGDESVLTDIINFICQNFVKVPYGQFVKFCDKLPKIVSVAKAVQWIFENFGKFIGWIQEVWTGEPHPRSQLELDIQAFYVAVEELRVSFPGMSSEELFSEDVQLKVALVKQEKDRLNLMVVKSKDMRVVFANRFNQGVTSLVNLEVTYGQNRKRAEKRTVPIWVYIYGKPGIGKSHDLDFLYVMVWNYLATYGDRLVDGPFHNGHLFELNQSEEFFDGYKQQIFFTIDDIFQSRDLDIRARTAERMIHFVSPAQYSLRVATVEEKAHCFFTSKCIFSTANMPPQEITDVKLSSPEALTSRITLALEKTDEGYVPNVLTPLRLPGEDRQVFTLEEIASIIGESILIREREKLTKVPDIIPSRLKFELRSARFNVEAQGKDDKEKEKEEDDPFNMKIGEEELIAKMEDLDKDPDFQKKIEMVMDIEHVERHEALLLLAISIYYGNLGSLVPEPEETVEHFLRRVCAFDSQFHRVSKEIPFVMTRVDGKRVSSLLEADRSVSFRSAMFKVAVETENLANDGGLYPNVGESYEDFRRRVAHMDERITRAKNKSKTRKAKSTYSEFKEEFADKRGFVEKYWKPFARSWTREGDTWFWKRFPAMFREVLRFQPGLCFHPWKHGVPTSFREWVSLYDPSRKEISEDQGIYVDWDFWTEHWEYVRDIAEELDRNPAAFVAIHKVPVSFTDEYARAISRTSLATAFVIIGASLAMYGILIYKVVRMFMPSSSYTDAQAAYEEKISKQQKLVHRARIDKRPNVMRKGKVENQGGTSELARMVANNGEVLEVRLSGPDEPWSSVATSPVVASCWVTFVYSNYALVPRHTMFGLGAHGEKRWFSLVRNQNYHVSEAEIEFCETVASDIVLVRFPDLQEKRDISKLFVDKLPSFGRMMHVQPDLRGTSYIPQVAIAYETKIQSIPVNDFYGSFETDAIFYGIQNEKGMCGTVYVHEATGKVVAMHMGGNQAYRTAYGVLLQRSDIDKYNPKYHVLDPIPSPLTTAQGIEGVSVLGQLPRKLGSFLSKETSLKLGMLDFKSFPVAETDSAPAKLAPFEKDGIKISPLQKALDKFGKQYRPPKIHKEPESVLDFFPKDFNFADAGKICSIEEALYGIPGYMKSIDFSTSAGYFYKKKGLTRKQLCFDERGNPRVHPMLRHDVEMIIHAIKRGCVFPVVFEEQLKDELKTKEKSDEGITRLYSSGDFASFVVQRMYLGRFFTELTKDPVGSPIGLSINPHSSQWGLLRARLWGRIEEKRKIRAGDFSNYDISQKNEVERRFKELLGHCFSDQDYVEVCLVVEANFQGWHVVGVIVFVRPWGTSSGSFITSMFNSFGNWYVHKTAFVNKYSEEEWKLVETTFTGDDSVISVPETHAEYDMKYLAGFFKEHFGMTYTSPTKTDDMNVTWENLTYLKRRFVMGEKGMMAPLDVKSLANMVKWTDCDQDEEVLSSIVQSVLLEAWHHGELFYQDCYDWCKKETKRLNLRTDVRSYYRMNVMRDPDY